MELSSTGRSVPGSSFLSLTFLALSTSTVFFLLLKTSSSIYLERNGRYVDIALAVGIRQA